jgi:hypothetical protein
MRTVTKKVVGVFVRFRAPLQLVISFILRGVSLQPGEFKAFQLVLLASMYLFLAKKVELYGLSFLTEYMTLANMIFGYIKYLIDKLFSNSENLIAIFFCICRQHLF